jgi:hypothetical protein
MAIFEADYYSYLFSEFEHRLGFSMAEAMIRGQRASAWDYLQDNVLYGWRKYAIKRLPVMLLIRRIASEIALFGFGKLEVLEYRHGKSLILKATRPFDIISLAWGIKGVVEFVEGKACELAWNKDGDQYLISVAVRPGKGDLTEVDKEALRAMRDAKRELSLGGKLLPPRETEEERCPSCGLPGTLAALEWREEDGSIYRRGSKSRFIFTSGHVIIGVIRDLERRTGQNLEPMMLEVTKNYHLRNLQGVNIRSRDSAYRRTAKYLAAGGFGQVLDLSYGEGHLEMTVGNPFQIPRLVGRIAGLFERIEGQEAEIEYRSPEPQVLEIEIKSA